MYVCFFKCTFIFVLSFIYFISERVNNTFLIYWLMGENFIFVMFFNSFQFCFENSLGVIFLGNINMLLFKFQTSMELKQVVIIWSWYAFALFNM